MQNNIIKEKVFHVEEDFYEQIIKELPKHLNKGGKVYFEVGIYQDKKVAKLLEENFEEIKILKDYANINRFVVAKSYPMPDAK